jgi:chromosomal replication initiator protein
MTPIPNEAIKEASEMQMPSHNHKGEPRIEHIQRVIVEHFPGVTMVDLHSARRIAKIVMPRQIAMYLSKVMTGRSLPEIGRRFGGRDHTTVLHAVRKIEALVISKPEIAATVEMLRKAIA